MSCMSKRQTDILSERLKDRLTKIKNDAELALVAVEEIGGLEVTCCKCHGEGKYYTLTQYQYEREEIKSHKCLICKGTGKITIDEYEDYQERCRR